MEIIKKLTNCNHNDGTIDRIKYIVVHYTGSTGSAAAQCAYFQSPRGASAHYFVDFDGKIYQCVEDKDIAWHCGGKSRYNDATNANSLGVEMCVRNDTSDKSASSKGWYFEDATVAAAIELVKELMQKYNVPESRVVRHWDVTHKLCGNPYYYNHTKHTWNDFKKGIGAVKNGWIKDYAGWKHYVNDKPETGWRDIDHFRYYFDSEGTMLTGWQFIEDAEDPDNTGWYYFEEPEYSNEGALWITDARGRQSRMQV